MFMHVILRTPGPPGQFYGPPGQSFGPSGQFCGLLGQFYGPPGQFDLVVRQKEIKIPLHWHSG